MSCAGPPGQVASLAGKKNGKEQGELGGILKELGYSQDQVSRPANLCVEVGFDFIVGLQVLTTQCTTVRSTLLLLTYREVCFEICPIVARLSMRLGSFFFLVSMNSIKARICRSNGRPET